VISEKRDSDEAKEGKSTNRDVTHPKRDLSLLPLLTRYLVLASCHVDQETDLFPRILLSSILSSSAFVGVGRSAGDIASRTRGE